jgi:[ribosomal protein S5]-alanine N-acetyltransferase
MELIPIKERLEENGEFANEPFCGETMHMTIEFHKKVGFVPPWIGYFAKQHGNLVGSAGLKERRLMEL